MQRVFLLKWNRKCGSTFALRQALDVLDVERLTRCERLSWAQIHYLQEITVINQHVVRFQVQVDHPTAVKVVRCTENLNQQLCNMILCVQFSNRAQTQVCSDQLQDVTDCHNVAVRVHAFGSSQSTTACRRLTRNLHFALKWEIYGKLLQLKKLSLSNTERKSDDNMAGSSSFFADRTTYLPTTTSGSLTKCIKQWGFEDAVNSLLWILPHLLTNRYSVDLSQV